MKVLVVCARRYNGHELWTALGVMQEKGIDFEVVSTSTLIADEVTKRPNTIDRTVYEVSDEELSNFDALMIISGNMSDTEAYWTDDKVLSLVDAFESRQDPIAAICCSVPTVRKAATGKRVSYFPLVRSKALLQKEGAILQTVSISRDGNLVTAEHQMATQVWAETFSDLVLGGSPEINLIDSGFEPEGRSERRLHPRLERLRGVELHPKNKQLQEEYFDNNQ